MNLKDPKEVFYEYCELLLNPEDINESTPQEILGKIAAKYSKKSRHVVYPAEENIVIDFKRN